MPTSVPVARTADAALNRTLAIVKEGIEWLTGAQKNAPVVQRLPETATLAELIAAYNKVADRINTP